MKRKCKLQRDIQFDRWNETMACFIYVCAQGTYFKARTLHFFLLQKPHPHFMGK